MNDNPIQPPATPDVETLMEQLRDPATLLANALGRIHEADALIGDSDDMEPFDLAFYKVVTGFVLDRIARTASDLAEAERRHTMTAVDDFLDSPGARQAAEFPFRQADVVPRAVNGVQFTADLTGHHVGLVAGREWLHVPGRGFIDVTHAQADGGTVDGARFQLTGRVVSATPDHVLGITPGGFTVTLPRALVTESPDE